MMTMYSNADALPAAREAGATGVTTTKAVMTEK